MTIDYDRIADDMRRQQAGLDARTIPAHLMAGPQRGPCIDAWEWAEAFSARTGVERDVALVWLASAIMAGITYRGQR